MAQKNKAILATNNLIRILSITAIIIMPMIVYPENTTTNDRIYSKEQAKSGEELYKTNCLICHDKKYSDQFSRHGAANLLELSSS